MIGGSDGALYVGTGSGVFQSDDGQTWVPNIRASAQTWDWTLNLPLDGGGHPHRT